MSDFGFTQSPIEEPELHDPRWPTRFWEQLTTTMAQDATDTASDIAAINAKLIDTPSSPTGIRFGESVLTFTGARTSTPLAVAHGLGRTPSAVLVTPVGGTANMFATWLTALPSATSMTLQAGIIDLTAATGSLTVFWLVIG